MNKTAEPHALAILHAIQAAEADGFTVEIVPSFGSGYHLSVGGRVRILEPTEEDEPWDMGEVTL